MKRYISKAAAAAAMLAVGLGAWAQNTESGYFVDEYTYRFQMNPAMGNDRNFVSMPAIGNLNLDMHGDLNLNDVLYNLDGRTVLFLNPGISAEQVMHRIDHRNYACADVKIPVMSAGFKAWGGYNTISITARANVNTLIPRSLFSLLKEGVANQSYDLTDLSARASAYAEVGLGHSHQLSSEVRVGGTLKFIIGGANMSTKINHATLTLGEEYWTVQSDATLNSSVKGLTYETTVNDRTGHEYVNGMKVKDTGPNGFGVGLDLGVVYTPQALPNWEFSAAVLDLGFIGWKNNVQASTNGLQEFVTSRYTFNVDSDAPNSFSSEWDKLRDDLSAIYELDDNGDVGSRTTPLAATVNLGVAYTLPAYDRLRFGLLNTTVYNGPFTYTDFRFSANVAPVDVFSAGVNFGAGTYGCAFGWMANLHVTGFNFFLGMDHTFGRLAKQGVPLAADAQFNLGMNFLF